MKITISREQRDYIIWGAASAVLNIGGFQLLIFMGADYKTANIITLIANRFFCYITNKIFVFRTKCDGWQQLIKEIVLFILARSVTLLMDYFGVVLLVEVIGIKSFISKAVLMVLVVLTNYLSGKWFVFKKDRAK
ncbi:MAG: GtrA family protein [Lachnospiraceae bacterium]|jgi:putative flippase GtrA|nr:GtrA family protein [Lachnospiraceae bacterium]